MNAGNINEEFRNDATKTMASHQVDKDTKRDFSAVLSEGTRFRCQPGSERVRDERKLIGDPPPADRNKTVGS